jgi:dihydrolipoamide dehydrogenase
MLECDVAVIGAGPGGYVAAIRAAQYGARTLVVERAELGGVCLNWGCIPTKTLIYTAELYKKMQHAADFGLEASSVAVDMKALIKRKDIVVRKNTGGVRTLFKAQGIELVNGEATIPSPGRIVVNGEEIAAKSIIVATGSEPGQVQTLPTDGKTVITSTEALDLTYTPESVLVIGAGAVGAEFAHIWNAFGAKVYLVEMLPHVLPFEDEELTAQLARLFAKAGIDVRTGTTVSKLDVDKGKAHVELEGEKPGSVEADLVLVAVGRKYNSDIVTRNPGLGIEVDELRRIRVDEYMATGAPGIYAIGDVVGKTMLAHGASAEGLVAATNATGKEKRRMDYRVVPACNFTSPEVASVGLTERKAREQGIDVHVGRFSLKASGRAYTMNATDGMIKIVGDQATDEVVGVHIMGAEAGELIATGALAMSMEATVEEIVHTIHTHPTIAEAMHEAAEDYYGLSIHTPPRK